MENVPEVVGTKNIKHFTEWIKSLEQLGYKNKYKIINATDFGVPQNRERCFMVSWLGDYYYDFPRPIGCKRKLKDLLERDVPESYYLKEGTIIKLNEHKERHEAQGHGFGWKPTDGGGYAHTVKTEGGYRPDSNFVIEQQGQGDSQGNGHGGNADGEGLQGVWQSTNDGSNGDTPPPTDNGIQRSSDTYIDIYNKRVVDSGICGTITANGNTSVRHCGTFLIIEDKNNRREQRSSYMDEIKCKQVGSIIGGGYNEMTARVYDPNGASPTVRTCAGGNLEPKIAEPHTAAMRGRNPDNPSDRAQGIATEQRLEIGGENANTITTVAKDSLVVEPSIVIGSMQKNAYVGGGEKCPTLTQAMGAGGGQTPMVGFSEQTPQDHIEVGKQIRVRKLTERECFRLQGVKDEDFDKVRANQSKSSCYHLAGDSIVVPVLMAIFGKMFDIDYEGKIEEVVSSISNTPPRAR